MLFLTLLLTILLSHTNTCPIFCRCFSASDGYHVACRNANLGEIPSNLTRFLQITSHQNLLIDLSSNSIAAIPCPFFQISTIVTLILTENRIQSLPSCFSQSSIETLRLNKNHLQFNQTTPLFSSKLLHLDISANEITHLSRTFFSHLRRLRTLVLDGRAELFYPHHDQWIRSLTTQNQLTLIICDEHFHLPLCLFDSLFQSRKLQALELNRKLHCDCSLVYLPVERVRFQHCQSHLPSSEQQGHCDVHSSRFAPGRSLIDLQSESNRQRCVKEYQTCQTIQAKTKSPLPAAQFDESRSDQQAEFVSAMKSTSTNELITSTLTTETSSKRDNISAGAILPFVLVLLIVTIVCLYVLLSGRLLKGKNHGKTTDLIDKRKKQHVTSSANRNRTPSLFDECLSIENINMNSNPRNTSFEQRTRSYSDDESELTFYSIPNRHASSTSFIQSSMTELETTSLTSTINSSLDNETVIIASGNKQRNY